MILVTVGTHNQPFDRLVRSADELARLVQEPVIIQRGCGSYQPKFAQHVDFVDGAQMEQWLSGCRVLISHAGAGSILSALQAGKPLVLAPRSAPLGEAMDDHQFELAKALSERGRAVLVEDLSGDCLAEAIERAARGSPARLGETGLHVALRDWLAQQAAQRSRRRRRFRRRARGEG